jgi:hypothetical protein
MVGIQKVAVDDVFSIQKSIPRRFFSGLCRKYPNLRSSPEIPARSSDVGFTFVEGRTAVIGIVNGRSQESRFWFNALCEPFTAKRSLFELWRQSCGREAISGDVASMIEFGNRK